MTERRFITLHDGDGDPLFVVAQHVETIHVAVDRQDRPICIQALVCMVSGEQHEVRESAREVVDLIADAEFV